MNLTKAQNKTVQLLQNAINIHYGVIWYMVYQGKNKIFSRNLDARVCNSLARKGVLINTTGKQGDVGDYVLADEYKRHTERNSNHV